MLENIRNGRTSGVSDWAALKLRRLRSEYLKRSWLKDKGDDFKTWESFNVQIDAVFKKKEAIIDHFLDNVPGLKMFLAKHSIFKIGANEDPDWLQQLMLLRLDLTSVDVERELQGQLVPEELLRMFSVFDPEPVGLELDDVYVMYDAYGYKVDPIQIYDRSFGKEEFVPFNIAKHLKSFEPISCATAIAPPVVTQDQSFQFDNDELPF